MFFEVLFGNGCNYDEDLTVTGTGSFTFDYHYPYLYVTDQGSSEDGILKIYDVGDPTTPSLISTTALPTDSNPTYPRYSNGILFIPYNSSTDSMKKLALWNVSNPASPALLGEVAVKYANVPGGFNGPTAVAIIGDIACCSVGPAAATAVDAVKIDCSDPTNPTVVATYNRDAGTPFNTYVGKYGNYFYLSGQTGSGGQGFVVPILASTFTGGSVVTSGTSGEDACNFDITEDGAYLYASLRNTDRLWTVSLSNPAAPTHVSRVQMTQTGTNTGTPMPVICVDALNRVYAGRSSGIGTKCICIMDISDRTTPVPSGSISTAGETVTDMVKIDGCAGFVWGQGTGASIHLLGGPPTS